MFLKPSAGTLLSRRDKEQLRLARMEYQEIGIPTEHILLLCSNELDVHGVEHGWPVERDKADTIRELRQHGIAHG